MLLHIHCNTEILNALNMMKYAVNHHWKFSNYRVAFLAGFLQCMVMFLITLINYMVITIEEDVISVAKDFTALLIVADFDDIFAMMGGGGEKAISIIEDQIYRPLFLREVTTSKDA